MPTLKGGNFDQLYDLHDVSYLHATMWFGGVAFVWVALEMSRWAKNQMPIP